MTLRFGRLTRLLLVTGLLFSISTFELVAKDKFLEIERKVDSSLLFLLENVPNTEDLMVRAKGMLVIPTVTKASFVIGGSYGEGALRVGEKTLEYYSSAQFNYGLQLGAQQYSHVLFFMTDQALSKFYNSDGFKLGANAEAAIIKESDFIGIDTINVNSDVVGVVFGQKGLILGASLEGTKYTRL